MTTPTDEPLGDDEIETTTGGGATGPSGDADGTDGGDADGTDGGDADGTDGDSTDTSDGDADGTDGGDADGTDGGDADGTDGDGRTPTVTPATVTPPTAPTATPRTAEWKPSSLLSGDAQNFVEKVWASHVHLHQTDPADLVGLLSFDDVDHLLTSTAIRTPAVRVAQDGSVLPPSRYTRSGASLAGQPLTGLVDPRKVIDLFEGGATVVLQGLHRYWPPLIDLVAELELALGHPCQANAYLTPPGSQGFAVHSDTHDVFVFQTHGSKQWEVHPAPGDEAARSVRSCSSRG